MTYEFNGEKYRTASSHQKEWGSKLIRELDLKGNERILDLGSAMGYFSLPMAEMVGPGGKVVCVDVQPKMLNVLRRRAAQAGMAERIETHLSAEDSLGLHGREEAFDFALAFTMLHEVGNQANFLREIYSLLKPGAALLLTEPLKHVSRAEFDRSISRAQQEGFTVAGHPPIRLSHTARLTKPPRPVASTR